MAASVCATCTHSRKRVSPRSSVICQTSLPRLCSNRGYPRHFFQLKSSIPSLLKFKSKVPTLTNRVAYVSCALIVSVSIESFSWFPSIPSLLKFKSKVPTLTNRVAGVSCVLIVSVFIECIFTGFPETMSDPRLVS